MHTVPIPSLPVVGGDERFPLRRVWCVGRNYAEHAREMGADPDREPPFFFAKPADTVFDPAEGWRGGASGVVPYPPRTQRLEHEVELVVALGRGGSRLDPETAIGLVAGYAVGVDLTRRDVQAQEKAARHPWEMGKSFDAAAPCSPLVLADPRWRPTAGGIHLAVDGEERQRGDLAQLIWSVADLLAELSHWSELAPGDLVFTGTPAGVGPIDRGQRVSAAVDGVARLDFVVR